MGLNGEGSAWLPEVRLGRVFPSLSCNLKERGLPQYLTFALIFKKSGFIPATPNPLSGTSCRLIHSPLGSREQPEPLLPSPAFLPSTELGATGPRSRS